MARGAPSTVVGPAPQRGAGFLQPPPTPMDLCVAMRDSGVLPAEELRSTTNSCAWQTSHATVDRRGTSRSTCTTPHRPELQIYILLRGQNSAEKGVREGAEAQPIGRRTKKEGAAPVDPAAAVTLRVPLRAPVPAQFVNQKWPPAICRRSPAPASCRRRRARPAPARKMRSARTSAPTGCRLFKGKGRGSAAISADDIRWDLGGRGRGRAIA